MADDKIKAKAKRPTAEKRMIQSEKRRKINKAFKSQIRTAIRRLEKSIEAKNKAETDQSLSTVYSLLDKAVKNRLYKKNKASRTKSRLTAKAASHS